MGSRHDTSAFTDAATAFGGSLFLHLVLIVVLAGRSDFVPLLGDYTRIDVLFFQPPDDAERPAVDDKLPPAPPHAPARPSRKAPPALEAWPAAPRQGRGPAEAEAALSAGSASFSLEPAPVVPARPAEAMVKAAAPLPFPPQAAAPAPAPAGGAPREAPEEEEGESPIARKEPGPATTPAPTSPTARQEVTATASASPAASPAASPPASPAAETTSRATAATATMQQATGGAAARLALLPANTEAVTARPAAGARRTADTKAPPAEREHGLQVASPVGDLKLVATGDGVEVSIVFRELARSRRNRPATRAESRRLDPVVPLKVRAAGRTEAVVEKAGEGVYLIWAQPLGSAPARSEFSLELRSPAGKKVAPLGKRAVAGKTLVAKVLMPEGVLWDDETAFTGSIQDGTSTVKFNADTGLYWKEYDE